MSKTTATNTKGYNGYKNYAQWNQSLWLNNDEGLYSLMRDAVRYNTRQQAADIVLDTLVNEFGMTHTPDGVKWSKAGILAAMVGL